MAIHLGNTTNWTKSSYSANGACVEVKSPASHVVAVRDSKAPDGPALGFTPGSWTGFLGQVRAGVSGRLD